MFTIVCISHFEYGSLKSLATHNPVVMVLAESRVAEYGTPASQYIVAFLKSASIKVCLAVHD